jgi:AcrR family transcriptional regulator
VGDLETLTAADLARRAGLPNASFDAHYGTIDNCLVATCDEVSGEIYGVLVDALAGPGDWHERFLAAIVATLHHIGATPGAGRLCFTEVGRGHPRVRARRAVAHQRVVGLLADEYQREHGGGLPELYFEFVVGALYRAAQDEVAAGRGPAQVAARMKQLVALMEPTPA